MLDLAGVTQASVSGQYSPKALSSATNANVWQLKTIDSQTIYVKRVTRSSERRARSGNSKPGRHPSPQGVGAETSVPVVRIKLSVHNIGATAAFYEDVLGLEAEGRSSPRFVSFGTLRLVDAKYASSLSGGAVDATTGPGRHRLEVCVSDLDAAYQRAVVGGYVVHAIDLMPWGERTFHCRDTEGNIVEVTENRKIKARTVESNDSPNR